MASKCKNEMTKKMHINDILPSPFEWCEIPKGSVTIEGGSGCEDYTETFDVQPFWMAKYPITYAQFRVFIEAPDGFRNDRWWQGLAADIDHKKQPGQQHWPVDKHPRENVSWHDAVAFCRWLGDKLGYEVRLPTEWEWQWAAEGHTGYKYPWGSEFDKNKCNTKESGIGQITPVDMYLAGASPFGVMDMAGNVCEWCLNRAMTPSNTDLSGATLRVVRGGSWDDNAGFARLSYRDWNTAHFRCDEDGFRIVTIPG